MRPGEAGCRAVEYTHLGFYWSDGAGSRHVLEFRLRKKHCTAVLRNYVKRLVRTGMASLPRGKPFRVRVFTLRHAGAADRRALRVEISRFSKALTARRGQTCRTPRTFISRPCTPSGWT